MSVDYDRMMKNALINLDLTEQIISEFYGTMEQNRKLILQEKIKGDEFQENMTRRTIAFKSILDTLLLWDSQNINYFNEKETPKNAA